MAVNASSANDRGGETVCTVNVAAGAQHNLAALMTLCARRLAELYGVDPDSIIMGPVDFGGSDQGEDHHQVDSPASPHTPTGGKPPHP